jgi:glycerol-3-phosphate dehydrogenase (NAD(P)+)
MATFITFLGSGAFSRALSFSVHSSIKPMVWGRSSFSFDFPVQATQDLRKALSDAHICFMVVSAQATREVAKLIASLEIEKKTLILCGKGMERETGALQTEIIYETLPNWNIGLLSGPNLSNEILQNKPAFFNLYLDAEASLYLSRLQDAFSQGPMRIVPCQDVIGLQVAGCLKNVMALGYGMLCQVNPGLNFLSAYLVAAYDEIKRFALNLGACEDSLESLGGMGDLILTATSPQSRNSGFGRAFPSELPLPEGVLTLPGLLKRASAESIMLPLSHLISDILSQNIESNKWLALFDHALIQTFDPTFCFRA